MHTCVFCLKQEMTSYFLGVLPILPTPLYCPTSGSIEQESEIMALLSIIMTTDPISEQCFKGYSMIGYSCEIFRNHAHLRHAITKLS